VHYVHLVQLQIIKDKTYTHSGEYTLMTAEELPHLEQTLGRPAHTGFFFTADFSITITFS
jgi:hypothetical protein